MRHANDLAWLRGIRALLAAVLSGPAGWAEGQRAATYHARVMFAERLKGE